MNYKPCWNAMETLVREEVDRQLIELGTTDSQDFDRSDAIAYALNRLPALYATTEEGWQRQIQRARRGLMDLISMTTTWGINEAQRKYRPDETPLTHKHVRPPAERALDELKLLFGREDLSWDNLSRVVHDAVQTTPAETIAPPALRAVPYAESSTPRTVAHPSSKRYAIPMNSGVDTPVHVKAG